MKWFAVLLMCWLEAGECKVIGDEAMWSRPDICQNFAERWRITAERDWLPDLALVKCVEEREA